MKPLNLRLKTNKYPGTSIMANRFYTILTSYTAAPASRPWP
jgi:hypothetical protein